MDKLRNTIYAAALFLVSIACCFEKNPLSVCAIFQNEAPYMKEWLEFHKIQGVTHFYLYNNNSNDHYMEVLTPYIEKKEVTLTDWPYTYPPEDHLGWISIQRKSYQHALDSFGFASEWMAFIDLDEFLFSPTGAKLPDVLSQYRGYGGVGVNWRVFGTSGVERIPEDKLFIETLIFCNRMDDPMNLWIKSIVQPRYVKKSQNAHGFLYKAPYFPVDVAKRELTSLGKSQSSLYDPIRINHYWTRDEEYFRNRKIESRKKRGKALKLIEMAKECNLEIDQTILQYVPELKMRMQ